MEGQVFCLMEEDENASCETPFKYLVPTLSHMASAKLIITLFSQALSETGKTSGNRYHDLSVGNAVREKIPSLVPKNIEPLLYLMIEHIEKEISHLDMDPIAGVIEFGFYRLNDVPKLWSDIVWTPRGSVDYNKMAENLLVDERVQHLTSYVQILKYMYTLQRDDDNTDFEIEWFYMNDIALFSADVLSYWGESDERRVELLESWLFKDGHYSLIHNRKEHYCSILSKISEKMMKRLLSELKKDVFRLFFCNLLYKDYCIQILDLMKLYGISFNDDSTWWTQLCNGLIHDPPKNMIEYQHYVSICRIIYYQLLPAEKTLEMVYSYLQVIRWEVDFEQVEYIISQMDSDERKNLLYYTKKGIISHLFKKNQVNFLIEFVKLCLSDENDYLTFKESLLTEKGKDIVSVHFTEEKVAQLKQFLEWALGSESRIEQFKKKIFVETFWSLLSTVHLTHFYETPLRRYQNNNPAKNLSAVDSFLEWCLSSKEAARRCKAFLAENLLRECESSGDSIREENTVEREFKLWLYEHDSEKIENIQITYLYSDFYKLHQSGKNFILNFYHDFWRDYCD